MKVKFTERACGYVAVMLEGVPVGFIHKVYRTWERRSKGRMYVNSRGKCKKPEYWAVFPDGKTQRWIKTRKEAVQILLGGQQP